MKKYFKLLQLIILGGLILITLNVYPPLTPIYLAITFVIAVLATDTIIKFMESYDKLVEDLESVKNSTEVNKVDIATLGKNEVLITQEITKIKKAIKTINKINENAEKKEIHNRRKE
jgi:hypothetical protein